MKKQIFILTIVLASVVELIAQRVEPITVQAIVVGSDTIPIIRLNEVEIYSFKIPKTRKAKKKLTRLIKNVKKVYPWARLAGIQLRKYDNLLSQAKNDKERRKIMKEAEKEINKKYGGSLKKLTFSQGKILIKLIDRETGNTSYSLVQVLRGNFTAFFYQAFARIWGYNLKVKYDPNGADKNIETIVRMIERGQI
jgi:hypothetical protein|tara:strand:- start:49 stop:633 length:585 start_codon:yes stop_codon:yes gene_type:complete